MIDHYSPLRYIVPAESDECVLYTVLHSKMGISRRLITRLKQTPFGIMVNGEQRYTNARIHTGDVVEVRMPHEQSDHILPQPIPFDLIYEDEHLLIVNKAAGIIVHPTNGHYTNTLANGIVHYWQQRGERHRFRPVHRLDQETSGALAIAKNPFVHQHISEQMKANDCYKEYLAVVYGSMSSQRGTIHAPIDRSPVDPHVRIVTETGYPATTHYEVAERYSNATVVRLWLETGRTHQIRVHLQHLGHPLIGDKLYGLSANGQHPADHLYSMERQALHAICLGFVHPITAEEVRFTAPIPQDMEQLIQQLQT